MYQGKPDHSYDWVMLVLLAILGVLLIVQQMALFTSVGSIVRFR